MQRAVGENGDNAIKKTESNAESRNIQIMIRNVVSLFSVTFLHYGNNHNTQHARNLYLYIESQKASQLTVTKTVVCTSRATY